MGNSNRGLLFSGLMVAIAIAPAVGVYIVMFNLLRECREVYPVLSWGYKCHGVVVDPKDEKEIFEMAMNFVKSQSDPYFENMQYGMCYKDGYYEIRGLLRHAVTSDVPVILIEKETSKIIYSKIIQDVTG